MDEICKHYKLGRFDHDYYLLTWSIPAATWIKELDTVHTKEFEINCCNISADLVGSRHGFTFCIRAKFCDMNCSVSLFLGSGTLLFSNTLKEATRLNVESESSLSYYDLMSLSHDSECFQKVNQHPYDTLILTCRIMFRIEAFFTYSVSQPSSANTVSYMKELAEALKSSSKSSLKEKVTLRVGEETEIVNKAVLCARSPVFADMFRSNKGEVEGNMVTIRNVKMRVMKALISFLYTGRLSRSDVAWNGDCDVDSLFELYHAAEKYGITELGHACVDLLLPKISMENIYRVLKFAFEHSDGRLKSTVNTFISGNIKTLVRKKEWEVFLKEETALVIEALNFHNI